MDQIKKKSEKHLCRTFFLCKEARRQSDLHTMRQKFFMIGEVFFVWKRLYVNIKKNCIQEGLP